MPPIVFAIQSYQSRSLSLSAQRMVNYYAEPSPPGAKSPVVVFNAPGTKALGAGGLAGAVRGALMMGGVLFVVAGDVLYSVTSAGVATSLGTINTTIGNVGMAANRASPQELCIVDGIEGWTYDTSNGLVQITDGDFKPAKTVAFIDGYFVFDETGTSRFRISNLNAGQTHTSTDFANAEGSPDEVVAVFNNHRELWVFGQETIEIYFNSGRTSFPFERVPGAYLERGLAAAFSIAEEDNTVYWLGDDGIVYKDVNYRPVRISTHAIEEAIRGFTDWSDAFAFFVTIEGHKFYHLTFPTGRATFVYDAATGLWHERESFGARYYRVSAYVFGYDKHIVGDAFQGRLGELDLDTFAEYGGTMLGIATGSPVYGDGNRIFHHRFEVEIDSGVGDTTGAASDPQMWMDYSGDGGRTWSARKVFQSMGKIGVYRKRLRWLRLGSARDRVYRVSTADPVKRTVIAAHLDTEPGDT